MDQSADIFVPSLLHLRVTRQFDCAYRPGYSEKRLAADLTHFPHFHDMLAEAGFRRVENWVYRPACDACQSCIPFRVKASSFQHSRNTRRILRRNADLVRGLADQPLGEEYYQLFQDYLDSRHNDGHMAQMDIGEFTTMILNSPIATSLVEYRDQEGRLQACVLVDLQRDGLSAVYSFFNSERARQSTGHFLILDMIDQVCAAGLDWLYLGFYVSESPKMSYKARYLPAEIFVDGSWQDFSAPK